MTPQLLPAQFIYDAPWTQTVVAFLAEKEHRSGQGQVLGRVPRRFIWGTCE
jgi:hypothetical protein